MTGSCALKPGVRAAMIVMYFLSRSLANPFLLQASRTPSAGEDVQAPLARPAGCTTIREHSSHLVWPAEERTTGLTSVLAEEELHLDLQVWMIMFSRSMEKVQQLSPLFRSLSFPLSVCLSVSLSLSVLSLSASFAL